jgi:hypothetical protein
MARIIAMLLCAIFLAMPTPDDDNDFAPCLKSNINFTQKVCYLATPDQPLTVRAVLKKLQARCQGEKLVDGEQREIIFYRVRPAGRRGGLCADYTAADFKYENIVKIAADKVSITLNPCADMLLK